MKLKHNRPICIGDAAQKTDKKLLKKQMEKYSKDFLLKIIINPNSTDDSRDAATDVLMTREENRDGLKFSK